MEASGVVQAEITTSAADESLYVWNASSAQTENSVNVTVISSVYTCLSVADLLSNCGLKLF